jgi:hypothetical protein
MDSGIRSHCEWESHLPAHSGSLDFHRVVPSLVLRTVSITRWVHRAFEAFDDSDQNLSQFAELRIFPMCDEFLVPWSHGVEPLLSWPDIRSLDPPELQGYWVLLDTQVSLRSSRAQCSLVTRHMAWHLNLRSRERLRFRTLNESCIPPSLLPSKCPGCKMLQSVNLAMRSLSQLR